MILETNQAVIEILKELHKENEAIMAAIKSKPWWETFAPGLYIIIGGVLTFFAQWRIFVLQKKKDLQLFNQNMQKEISIKIAELFGKYKNLSTHFTIMFYEFDTTRLKYDRNVYLWNYYKQIVSDEETMSYEDEEGRDNFYNQMSYYYSAWEKQNETIKSNKEKYNEHKLKILELLHQIHYYSKDETLNELIQQFYKTNLHTYIGPEKYTHEIATNEYISQYTSEHIKKNQANLHGIFKKISKRILEL